MSKLRCVGGELDGHLVDANFRVLTGEIVPLPIPPSCAAWDMAPGAVVATQTAIYRVEVIKAYDPGQKRHDILAFLVIHDWPIGRALEHILEKWEPKKEGG